MASLEGFYNDSSPWTPPTNCYPTWDTAMRFYKSRIQEEGIGSRGDKVSTESVAGELTKFCVDVWEVGDGCPGSWIKVEALFKKDILPSLTS